MRVEMLVLAQSSVSQRLAHRTHMPPSSATSRKHSSVAGILVWTVVSSSELPFGIGIFSSLGAMKRPFGYAPSLARLPMTSLSAVVPPQAIRSNSVDAFGDLFYPRVEHCLGSTPGFAVRAKIPWVDHGSDDVWVDVGFTDYADDLARKLVFEITAELHRAFGVLDRSLGTELGGKATFRTTRRRRSFRMWLGGVGGTRSSGFSVMLILSVRGCVRCVLDISAVSIIMVAATSQTSRRDSERMMWLSVPLGGSGTYPGLRKFAIHVFRVMMPRFPGRGGFLKCIKLPQTCTTHTQHMSA